jgi:hypothetical protein
MIVECGPANDRRIMSLQMPLVPTFESLYMRKIFKKFNGIENENDIAILVSGGLDSAILYFLLIQENINTGKKFNITPFTMMRKEGSRYYAKNVINWIHRFYGIPEIELNLVGDNTLPEIQQVESAIAEIFSKQISFVYIGIIEARPEHSINWFRAKFNETVNRKYPFLKLQKSHIIDLYLQNNLLELLSLTYSCAVSEKLACGRCNGCNERFWGLSQYGL